METESQSKWEKRMILLVENLVLAMLFEQPRGNKKHTFHVSNLNPYIFTVFYQLFRPKRVSKNEKKLLKAVNYAQRLLGAVFRDLKLT